MPDGQPSPPPLAEKSNGPLKVGIGGPVGAGKTTLAAALARALKDELSLAVITNDIYTQQDGGADADADPPPDAPGVETGAAPRRSARTHHHLAPVWASAGATPTST